ncbi:MAG: hypothetical protein A4E36_00154 [Methanoregulaceae archaeon PtaB.Bin009]|nr:MAG: hypothetical protein A4E36_00154 [Methanoregulaceae archaeon PtaB.Bin009]
MNLSRNTALAIFAVVVLIVIGVYVLSGETLISGGDTHSSTGGQEPLQPTPTPLQTPAEGATIMGTTIPTLSPTTRFTTSATPSPSPIPQKRPVEFTLDSGTPVNCGLTCRETTATITNTGDEVAHSVCVVLEVFNENGEQIFINSAPSIERCLGDIGGGESRSETITINADCGFLASKCIGHTLILKARATSLERSQAFPDSYIVV